jgi:O-antigen/teichoic acid export membrane protein
MFARAISGLTGNVLVAAGHTKLNLLAEVVAALTNVGLNIVLIPKYGILGAAMGTSTTYLVRSMAFVSFTYLKVRVHPYNRDYYKIMAAAGGSAVGLYFFKEALSGVMHWVPLMFLSGLVLLALFVALLIPTRFMDRNDGYVLEAITGKFGLKNSRFDKLFKKP